MAYSAPDAVAASSWRGRGRIAGLRAPADRQGEAPVARRRAGARQARGRDRRLPDEPEGPRPRDGAPGVRGARRRAAARAEARGRSVRRGAARGRARRGAARGSRPGLLDGGARDDRSPGAHQEGRPRGRRHRRAQGADAASGDSRDRLVSAAPFACVDIGSNTTRLLAASWDGSELRELMTQRVYTRLGKVIRKTGAMPPESVATETEVVATQVRHARELGARDIRIVATAAIRQAPNRDELVRSIEDSTGLSPHVLTDAEEARLAFLGASRTLGSPPNGSLGVLDVGGGSTELAAGNADQGVSWFASFSIGSGFLADSYLRSDPPSAHELHAAGEHAKGCFEGLVAPEVERAVAVGGSATALRRVAGGELSHEALERAIRIVSTAPSHEVAERFELDAERVRLLPAGILIIDAVSDAIGWRLKIGGGGIREGCILEMAAAAETG